MTQQRRRCVERRTETSRHEVTIGHARMNMHMAVDHRADTVQKADGVEA
jgi:hypothetical protein